MLAICAGSRTVVRLQRAGGFAQLRVKQQCLACGKRVAQRVLRLLRGLPQAVKPGIGSADPDGGGDLRFLHHCAQMARSGGGARHEFRRFIAADDEHNVLVAEQPELRGRTALRHPMSLRLKALGALRQRRQRDRMEPPAKLNTGGKRRLRQLLRRVGL